MGAEDERIYFVRGPFGGKRLSATMPDPAVNLQGALEWLEVMKTEQVRADAEYHKRLLTCDPATNRAIVTPTQPRTQGAAVRQIIAYAATEVRDSPSGGAGDDIIHRENKNERNRTK